MIPRYLSNLSMLGLPAGITPGVEIPIFAHRAESEGGRLGAELRCGVLIFSLAPAASAVVVETIMATVMATRIVLRTAPPYWLKGEDNMKLRGLPVVCCYAVEGEVLPLALYPGCFALHAFTFEADSLHYSPRAGVVD